MGRAQRRRMNTAERVLTAVRDHPGSTYHGIARILDVHVSTVEYHAHRLERQRVLSMGRAARPVRLYPLNEGWCRRARAAHAVLSGASLDALHVVVERGTVRRSDLQALGHSRSAVRWALGRLVRSGILVHRKRGAYGLGPESEGCARVALGETSRCVCVDESQRLTANRSPSPSGSIEASSSG